MISKLISVLSFALASLVSAYAAPAAAPSLEITPMPGYQTTARGSRALLYCLRLKALGGEARVSSLAIELPAGTSRRVNRVELYLTPRPDLLAQPEAQPILRGHASKSMLMETRGIVVPRDSVRYLWITATVKRSAPVGSMVSVRPISVSYVMGGSVTTDMIATSEESAGTKVFATQSFPYVPTTRGCRFYRIPAMVRAADGSIVVAADMRYNSNTDLGNHHIDVAARRSTDGGRSWSEPVIIARGGESGGRAYGYGDPALAVTGGGRIVCAMATGSNLFWHGMKHIGLCTSDDNGQTWSAVRDMTAAHFTDEESGTRDSLGARSIFTTSGRGITTRNGETMFVANVLLSPKNVISNRLLVTSDEGDSWTLRRGSIYEAGDESKLAQLADGRLLASIRQDGKRGFNICPPSSSNWGTPWRSSTLSGNACNSDIISYGTGGLLLHTILADTADRRDLRIYASTDEGATWHEAERIQPGYAAYSTMEVLPSGDLALLFEDASFTSGGYTLTYITIPATRVKGYADACRR